ncbi:MAG: hypothetical protein V5A68_00820 [Candidatus Thermoplasmatota archaeon]
MSNLMILRSVSFDTSFLLKDKVDINLAIDKLSKDDIDCFVTSTVVSELENLRMWDSISKDFYRRAMVRMKKTGAKVIDFKNRLLSDAFGKQCVISMKKYHGVSEKNIVNDCNILVQNLKNGVDLFLSEDFHFTSRITRKVIDEVKNNACSEFHQMCGETLFSVDASVFNKVYSDGKIDLDLVEKLLLDVRKKG